MAGITEAQGTKLHFVATSVSLANAAAIKTAISSAKTVICLNELGDVNLGTKSVTEYQCMSSDETFKSLGSISLGNFTPELLYNAADTAGQKDLRDMWEGNERRQIIIELNDQITPTTGNPTYIHFEVAVSSPAMGITKGQAVTYKPTVEICTVPLVVPAK